MIIPNIWEKMFQTTNQYFNERVIQNFPSTFLLGSLAPSLRLAPGEDMSSSKYLVSKGNLKFILMDIKVDTKQFWAKKNRKRSAILPPSSKTMNLCETSSTLTVATSKTAIL